MSYASPLDHPSGLLRHGARGASSRASNEARGIVQVLTKIVRGRCLDAGLDDIRPAVRRLVEVEEGSTGSKMLAYERVGREIGKSPSWVRKLVGRHHVGLQWLDVRAIAQAYLALCEDLERAAAADRKRAEELWRQVDAPFQSADRLVEGPEGSS